MADSVWDWSRGVTRGATRLGLTNGVSEVAEVAASGVVPLSTALAAPSDPASVVDRPSAPLAARTIGVTRRTTMPGKRERRLAGVAVSAGDASLWDCDWSWTGFRWLPD